MELVNPSTAQALVLVDELVRCGVSDVVLAPGSRNAPLSLALAAADALGRLRLHVRVDERTAGYLAVGLGLRSRRAAAVVTTSGTAAANLLPAVTEAAYAGVPLLVLTADRPPELRDTGANQAIAQAGMFRDLARWSHDLGVAERRTGQVAYWRSVVDRAVDVAIEDTDPGPVHLNVPLRAPLTPTADDAPWPEPLGLVPEDLDPEDLPDLYPRTVDGRLTLTAAQPLDEVLAPLLGDPAMLANLLDAIADDEDDDELDIDLSDDGAHDDNDDDVPFELTDELEALGVGVVPARGVVVVGHDAEPDHGDAAIALAEACGWPLIAEPTGNARTGDTTLAHGPLLLADPSFAETHQPEIAVVVGRIGLDRSVLALVERTPVVVGVDARAASRRADPTRNVTVFVAQVPEPPDEYDAYDDSWLDAWLAADARAGAAVERTLDATESLTGPDVARTVWDICGADQLLFVASSWPVRHLGAYSRVRDDAEAPLVVGNRGVSGIDGLVSSAWGAALAHQDANGVLVEDEDGVIRAITTRGGAAYALLGDLAFLHDHNGLVVGPEEPQPDLVIVVVDNDGGGIFGQLEQAGSEHFERVFGTPHGLDLVAVASAAGVPVRRVEDVTSLVQALDEATAAGGVHVVIARVGDRASEAALLTRLQAAVSDSLAEATAPD